MNVFFWRSDVPLFEPPATFARFSTDSMGGTDNQLLWHAQSAVELGHEVSVFGVTTDMRTERGVKFIGAVDAIEQRRCLADSATSEPDVVFIEGDPSKSKMFRELFPSSVILVVGQNIDQLAANRAFSYDEYIDWYCFVSLGHLAHYCAKKPMLRHKFVLLRNCVPIEELCSEEQEEENKIVWVGGWGKKGLRRWGKVMAKVMAKHPGLEWELYGPAYDKRGAKIPPSLFFDLELPQDRISIHSLATPQLFKKLKSSKIILTSLGNETASIATLEGHAAGRPVLSGNDMVYLFANPLLAGMRINSIDEGYRAIERLLCDDELRQKLGSGGRRLVNNSFSRDVQKKDLSEIFDLVSSHAQILRFPSKSDQMALMEDYFLRLERKLIRLKMRFRR